MAARGRMRVSRDGGRNYTARDERGLTHALPNQPTAVLVYDSSGCAPIICIDLDSSRGGSSVVDRDHRRLSRLFTRLGLRWFSDVSPNGGRHIYVPLAKPVPFHEAKAVVKALAARTPSLDPLPMLNLNAGCIRIPGTRHRSGGHQVLDQTLSHAYDTLMRPSDPGAWQRLVSDLDVDVEATEQLDSAPEHDGDEVDRLEPLRGFSAPTETFQAIARTGEFPSAKYGSPSEARQAVIWAAVASGWRLVDVARRLSDGTWAGLASFYARYARNHRHQALVRDWRAAISFEKQRREKKSDSGGIQSVRQRTTSPPKTQRGAPGAAVNQEVRVWLAAVDMLCDQEDVGTRAVLYALAEAAVLRDDLVVEHGNRSLAIATGLDQSTVGRVLKALRERPRDRALVDQVRPAEGVRAASYALVIPPLLRPACERKPWRRGRIHAVRPVFRELGLVAAFVYAALEQGDEPLSGRALAQAARLSPSATYEALMTLTSWGMAEKVQGGWVLGEQKPDRVAERFDVTEQVAAQIAKYRAERIAWWRYLGVIEDPTPLDVAQEPPPEVHRPPPWEDEDRLVALLERKLGATLIA